MLHDVQSPLHIYEVLPRLRRVPRKSSCFFGAESLLVLKIVGWNCVAMAVYGMMKDVRMVICDDL